METRTNARSSRPATLWITDPFTPIAAGLLVLFLVGAAVLAF